MTANKYQTLALQALSKHFKDVEKEWSVARGATDTLRYGVTYAPRLDIAVGPFNTGVGNAWMHQRQIGAFEEDPAIRKIIQKNRDIRLNPNPRCVLAVEIEFSGSSKHILGDFTNASMMGLVGVVIVPPDNFKKASRIHKYVEFIRRVYKAPPDLFSNLVLFTTDEFLELLE